MGYRWSANARATELGITGWVRNRADGTVEAEIEGTADQVEAMLGWMRRGPQYAAVNGVDVSELPDAGGSGFDIQ